MTMKTADFIREHRACRAGARWALSISDNMANVWDAMIKQNRHDWLLWAALRPGVFSDTVVRKLACRFVRETPVGGGKTVWDLLEDAGSRKAVEVAEAYADGNATDAELSAAYAAACVAAEAAHAAASDAAWAAAACVAADYFAFCATVAAYAVRAARAAGRAAADAAAESARSAQVRMIAELGNPFKEESPNENC